ncbi:MAG: ABC transporter substrate-binding protein [Pseudomonadota bacterium]
MRQAWIAFPRRACAALAFTAAQAACAADLTLAQVDWSRGEIAREAAQSYAGAKACVDLANASGGVAGRRLRLVRVAAAHAKEEPAQLLARVVQQEQPLAILNLTGADYVRALLKSQQLYASAVPVVGVSPGAESLRAPWNPYVFHLRAGDRAQLARMLSHLGTLGLANVAVAYEDDEFGRDGLRHVQELAGAQGVAVKAAFAVPAARADAIATVAKTAAASGAQAHLLVLRGEAGVRYLAALRQHAGATPVYGMSYLSAGESAQGDGGKAPASIALAQITPNPAAAATPLTREYLRAMKEFAPPGERPSPESLAGCIAARTVVEALRRMGGEPTPARLTAQLWNLRADLGGFVLDLTGSNVGSHLVDIGWVDAGGRLRF